MAWAATVPSGSPFPGVCRVNRAHLARLSGSWPEALTDAVTAAADLAEVDPATAGAAFYEAGEIRRRTGDLAGAESDFASAGELGFEPQPGLALLRLAQGKEDAARTALQVALSGSPPSRLREVPLLTAQVEVALAAKEPDRARSSADRLRELAASLSTAAVQAAADTAVGAVELAEEEIPSALESLRRACATWRDLRLPYETARARMLFGRALRAAGDEEDARLELQAALAIFERLGATPDVAATAVLLGPPVELPRGLTRTGGRGPPARRGGEDEPGHRRRARDQRTHGRPASAEHVREARRLVTFGGDGVRVRARSRLTRRSAAPDGPFSPSGFPPRLVRTGDEPAPLPGLRSSRDETRGGDDGR